MPMKEKVKKELYSSGCAVLGTILVALCCNILTIPNPNIILFTVMTVALVFKGYVAGLSSGVVILIYSMYFFSNNHDFVTYSALNVEKIIVIIIGILLDILFIGHLHTKNEKALERLRLLNERLSSEKAALEERSRTGALTQLQNRHAFREDYDSFIHREVFMMIFDVDYFKRFNDTYGHDMGDCVLKTVADYMMELFGQKHCYRWGGDEFLIVVPEPVEEIAKRKIQGLQTQLKHHSIKNLEVSIGITCGYVIGRAETDAQVRELLEIADGNLYTAKETERGTVIGTQYDAK